MSANYHTPLGVGAALDSIAFNTIFGNLDAGITGLNTRVTTLEGVRAGTEEQTRLNIGDGSTKTLASNAFSPSASFHYLDTEGAAATDYLDTINGGSDGDILWLQLANAARVVTIRNIDNIQVKPTGSYEMSVNDPLPGFYENDKWTFRASTAVPPMAILHHEEADGVNGGDFYNGAWRTRDINTKISDASIICAIKKLAFTVGIVEIEAGDTIVGETSGATAEVFDVELTGGSWAGGDAAGNLWIYDQTGTFGAEDIEVDTVDSAQVAADSTTGEIRILAGTYRVVSWAVAYQVSWHQTKFVNTTDTDDIAIGSVERAAGGDYTSNRSALSGRFTITESKTFELQHRCSTTNAGDGFGTAASFGVGEVYAQVILVQES